VHFAEAATGTGEILRRGKNNALVYFTESGDDAVRWYIFLIQTKQSGAVFYEKLDFFKSAFVE